MPTVSDYRRSIRTLQTNIPGMKHMVKILTKSNRRHTSCLFFIIDECGRGIEHSACWRIRTGVESETDSTPGQPATHSICLHHMVLNATRPAREMLFVCSRWGDEKRARIVVIVISDECCRREKNVRNKFQSIKSALLPYIKCPDGETWHDSGRKL